MNQSQDKKTVQAIADRLREVRKKLGLSLAELAEKAGIYKTQYPRYEKGQDFQISSLYKLKQAIPNLNLNWLLTGEGEMFTDTDVPILPLSREMLEVVESEQRGDYVVIPFYRQAAVSAGEGRVAVEFPPDPLILPKEYLRKFLGVTSFTNLTLIPVSGKSMDASLPDESVAVVQDWKKDGTLIDGKVYVIRVDDLLYAKRVYFDRQKKKLYLRSDNPDVPKMEIEWDYSVEIIGRVVGCICFVRWK